jgi:hypothetical protein
MALLETFLADFAYGIKNPEPGDPPYSELIKDNPSYELAPYQRVAATLETQALTDMDEQMSKELLEKGSPHPEPNLVISPSF